MKHPTSENAQSLHYGFAHLVLPVLALGNPKKLYKVLDGGGGLSYLISIWRRLERGAGSYPHDGLEIEKFTFGGRFEAFVIIMPEPRNLMEASFICVVFEVRKRFLGKEVSSVRYFTLELGKNLLRDPPEYHFCEWNGGIPLKHKNYGPIPML